jgi:MoaA/NifB/PqqE/SkfB family radical SAM enzyme
MLRSLRLGSRALGWAARHRQWWLLSWFTRGRLRALTLPFDYRRADGGSRPPLGVTLRVTMRCNLRCRMCHVVHAQDDTAERLRAVRDIPLGLAKSIIDQLAETGTYVCLSGGEPLLYRELPALISHARERGVVTTMATNATRLEERAEELVTSGLKIATISLLGPRDVHNETTCIPDAFERLAAGIRALDRVKREHGSVTPITIINCPMTDLNARRLNEVADIVSEWPIAAVNFQHMWFKPASAVEQQEACHAGLLEEGAFAEMGDADEAEVDVDSLATEVEALLRRRGAQPAVVYPDLGRQEMCQYYLEPTAQVGPDRAVCLWLFTMIHPNGEVSPCEGFNAGNLNDQTLMEIWNGEKLRRFRRTLRDAGTLPVCHRCCVFYRRH